MSQNPLKNLRVISYNGEIHKRQIAEDAKDWLLIEGCARHVFLTLSPEAIVPEAIVKGSVATKQKERFFAEFKNVTRVEEGEAAYRYLLLVVTGLLSTRRGDIHEVSRVLNHFHAHEARDNLTSDLVHFRDMLLTDCRKIQAHILSNLHPYSCEPALAARKILEMRGGRR